jgi:uncharacterized protein (DUF2062 family)
VTITITTHGFNPLPQLPTWLVDLLSLLGTIFAGLTIGLVTVLLAAAAVQGARRQLRRRRLQRNDR